ERQDAPPLLGLGLLAGELLVSAPSPNPWNDDPRARLQGRRCNDLWPVGPRLPGGDARLLLLLRDLLPRQCAMGAVARTGGREDDPYALGSLRNSGLLDVSLGLLADRGEHVPVQL